MFDDVADGEADIKNGSGVVSPFCRVVRVPGVVHGREDQDVDRVDPEIAEEAFEVLLRVLVVDRGFCPG